VCAASGSKGTLETREALRGRDCPGDVEVHAIILIAEDSLASHF